MRRREAAGNLDGVLDRLTCGDRPFPQTLAKRLAVEELHHGVHLRAVDAVVVDREDVRVGQRRDGLRFALEASEPIGIGREELGQDFQRNIAIQPRIVRAVDLAHAARSDGGDDFVNTNAGAGGQWQRSFAISIDPCRP